LWRYKLNKVCDRDEVVNGVPLPDGWADGTDEPRVGTVLEVLCGS